MVSSYSEWVADGSPWHDCQPTRDLITMLRSHGYSGPGVGLGDMSHLTAPLPEDHCPYSHTPWPGAQPYPAVMAIDIMAGYGVDVVWLGGKLFDDKQSGVEGTQPLKYMNWTDADGHCWHDSWMPSHARYASTDRGHIHLSWRTEYATSTIMQTYDPYGTSTMEDDMHLVAMNDDTSIYVAPGGLAVSGRMAAYGLTPAQWQSYQALGLRTVVLPSRAEVGTFYDIDPQPWTSGLAQHVHAGGTTGGVSG